MEIFCNYPRWSADRRRVQPLCQRCRIAREKRKNASIHASQDFHDACSTRNRAAAYRHRTVSPATIGADLHDFGSACLSGVTDSDEL
jgi:hypothetical protein